MTPDLIPGKDFKRCCQRGRITLKESFKSDIEIP